MLCEARLNRETATYYAVLISLTSHMCQLCHVAKTSALCTTGRHYHNKYTANLSYNSGTPYLQKV